MHLVERPEDFNPSIVFVSPDCQMKSLSPPASITCTRQTPANSVKALEVIHSLKLFERLIEVGDDIIRIFNSDRDSHQSVGYS